MTTSKIDMIDLIERIDMRSGQSADARKTFMRHEQELKSLLRQLTNAAKGDEVITQMLLARSPISSGYGNAVIEVVRIATCNRGVNMLEFSISYQDKLSDTSDVIADLKAEPDPF